MQPPITVQTSQSDEAVTARACSHGRAGGGSAPAPGMTGRSCRGTLAATACVAARRGRMTRCATSPAGTNKLAGWRPWWGWTLPGWRPGTPSSASHPLRGTPLSSTTRVTRALGMNEGPPRGGSNAPGGPLCPHLAGRAYRRACCMGVTLGCGFCEECPASSAAGLVDGEHAKTGRYRAHRVADRRAQRSCYFAREPHRVRKGCRDGRCQLVQRDPLASPSSARVPQVSIAAMRPSPNGPG